MRRSKSNTPLKTIKFINNKWPRCNWPRACEKNSATRTRSFDHNVYKQRAMHTQDPDFSALDLTCHSEEIIPPASINPNRRYSDRSRSLNLASIAAAAIQAINTHDPIKGEKILMDMKNASSDNSLLALKLQEMIVSVKKERSEQ
mmetsp:Transcript_43112/g.101113  ORF Transcript_43112/g.101113 Transcript_43112/m.101113 type:complete len:145 (-) Transcript_43112:26-460(-)